MLIGPGLLGQESLKPHLCMCNGLQTLKNSLSAGAEPSETKVEFVAYGRMAYKLWLMRGSRHPGQRRGPR